MYNDAFAIPIATLGESLNRVNTAARRILFYIPGRVSDRALCVATATGFEPVAVERINPPSDDSVSLHYNDTFTKLSLWKFGEYGIKGVVYLDADMLVRRNFDELFRLPYNFAAVPDVYLGPRGFTVDINTGFMFVRPSAAVFRDLVARIDTADYDHSAGEQGYLNVWHSADAVRLPYVYNGNLAIKERNPELWRSLQPELRVIHYTLVKPHWRLVYDDMGFEDMHENVLRWAERSNGIFREEVLEWGRAWKDTEEKYHSAFTRCRQRSDLHVA